MKVCKQYIITVSCDSYHTDSLLRGFEEHINLALATFVETFNNGDKVKITIEEVEK